MKSLEKHSFINQFELMTGEKIYFNRERKNVYLKIIFSKILRNHNYTLSEIKNILGLTNHATILHHLKIYDNLLNYYDFQKYISDYYKIIETIIRKEKTTTIEVYINDILLENFNGVKKYNLTTFKEKLIFKIYN